MKKILNKIKKKWPEYILEIFVIIVGILLAFSLNNWNENRIERKEKRNYLVNLLDNLNSDHVNLEQQTQLANKWAYNLDTLIDMLLRPKNFSQHQFLTRINSAKLTPSFIYVSSTFDNLNNSGKLHVLNDPDLIKMLFNYYHEINIYQKREDFTLSFSRNQLIPLLNKLDPLIMSRMLDDLEIELLSARPDSNFLQQDLSVFSENSELFNYLVTKRGSLRFQMANNYKNLDSLNNALIAKINGILNQ